MRRRSVIALLMAGTGAGALALTGCTPLTAFNAVIPKDNGVIKLIDNAAYGPDPRQRLDIYRPMTPNRHLPMIVFFYGGSWNSGDKDGYAWVGRALAARGYVVVIPNYRLVPQVRYPAFIEDGAAAIGLAIRIAESIGADPNWIIIAGHSAGAYNGAMLAYDERWLGKDRARVHGFIGLAGPYDFLPLDGPAVTAAFASARNLKSTQPVEYADRRDPPAFLAVAGEDRTVHPRNAANFARKLKAAGVPVEVKTYPKVGHAGLVTAIAKPFRGRASVLNDMVEFAARVSRPDQAR